MKSDYLKFVQWSEPDQLFVGYCPDLFIGGICHGSDEQLERIRDIRSSRVGQTATGIVTSALFFGSGRLARWLAAISSATWRESSR